MVKMTKWVSSGSGRGAEQGRGSEAYQQPEFTAQRAEAGWAGVLAQGAISHRLTLVLALVLTEGGRELLGSP